VASQGQNLGCRYYLLNPDLEFFALLPAVTHGACKPLFSPHPTPSLTGIALSHTHPTFSEDDFPLQLPWVLRDGLMPQGREAYIKARQQPQRLLGKVFGGK
jgi:hypothetical protein